MKITLSESFYPLLKQQERYLVLCGGRGSGKSEFAARKIFYRCMKEGNHRYLVLRKIRKTAQETCILVVRTILAENNIIYNYNKTDRKVSFTNPAGQPNEIIFDGLDEWQKIKSYKAATSIWMEELTEFTKDDFREIDLILREPTKYYKQIMMTFNPDEACGPWIKKMFFDKEYPSSYIHESTVHDNPIKEVRDQYLKVLEGLDDETYRDIYLYGIWALAKGQIFNWDVWKGEHPSKMNVDEIFYGGDFGYSVNPASYIRIYRKANEFWVEEIVYETKLTNPMLAQKIKDEEANDAESYWDSSEPKSIQELYDCGIKKVKPCEKGADSVRAGIDYLKGMKIHIIEGAENIIRERSKYKWKVDKDGNPLPEPVKFDDHAMDAIRYGIFTHCKREEGAVGISKVGTGDIWA